MAQATHIPKKVFISLENSQIIRVVGLFYVDAADNNLTPIYFDATSIVFATLFDQFQTPIPGCTDLALAYVTGSQGNFAGIIDAIEAEVGSGYNLFISADQGGIHNEWNIDCEVILRTE